MKRAKRAHVNFWNNYQFSQYYSTHPVLGEREIFIHMNNYLYILNTAQFSNLWRKKRQNINWCQPLKKSLMNLLDPFPYS